MSGPAQTSRRKRDVLAGALAAVVLAHILQLPATAVGSMTFLSGELTFGPLGRSDQALAVTEAAQRIEMRPSAIGRERLSVYVAIRRVAPHELAIEPTSALAPSVVSAVSRVPLVPTARPATPHLPGHIASHCTDASLGIDAQLRWRIVVPRTFVMQQGPEAPPSLVAFHRADEEWIVERSCLGAC